MVILWTAPDQGWHERPLSLVAAPRSDRCKFCVPKQLVIGITGTHLSSNERMHFL